MKLRLLVCSILLSFNSAWAGVNQETWKTIVEWISEVGKEFEQGNSSSTTYTMVDGDEDANHTVYAFALQTQVRAPGISQSRTVHIANNWSLNPDGNWNVEVWVIAVNSKGELMKKGETYVFERRNRVIKKDDLKIIEDKESQASNDEIIEKWDQIYKYWLKNLGKYKQQNDVNTI